jgi:hypothetical protein
MRSAIQAASLRIQQHAQLHNGNDAPGLSATALQICSIPRAGSSAGVHVSDGSVGPDMYLAVQLINNPDLRGTINAMVRLIEEHGVAELRRVGVRSQEGDMQTPTNEHGMETCR